MICYTCKREMTMEMMPCSICEAKNLSEVNMTGEFFEIKMDEKEMVASTHDTHMDHDEEIANKMMHGEGDDMLDEEIAAQFTVSVDDLKQRHTAPPPDDMPFYADAQDTDEEEEKER